MFLKKMSNEYNIIFYVLFFVIDSLDEIESIQSPSNFINEINFNEIELLKVSFFEDNIFMQKILNVIKFKTILIPTKIFNICSILFLDSWPWSIWCCAESSMENKNCCNKDN